MTKAEREVLREVWVGRIADFRASGQSRRQWAREHGVPFSQVRYWVHRIPAPTMDAETARWAASLSPGPGPAFLYGCRCIPHSIQANIKRSHTRETSIPPRSVMVIGSVPRSGPLALRIHVREWEATRCAPVFHNSSRPVVASDAKFVRISGFYNTFPHRLVFFSRILADSQDFVTLDVRKIAHAQPPRGFQTRMA